MGRFHAGSKYTASDIAKQNASFAKAPKKRGDCKDCKPISTGYGNSRGAAGSFMPAQNRQVPDAWYRATGTPKPI